MLGRKMGAKAARVAPKKKKPTTASYKGGSAFQEAEARNNKLVNKMKKKKK